MAYQFIIREEDRLNFMSEHLIVGSIVSNVDFRHNQERDGRYVSKYGMIVKMTGSYVYMTPMIESSQDKANIKKFNTMPDYLNRDIKTKCQRFLKSKIRYEQFFTTNTQDEKVVITLDMTFKDDVDY